MLYPIALGVREILLYRIRGIIRKSANQTCVADHRFARIELVSTSLEPRHD